MNTFQVIVIGTLLALFGGSGYYFFKADNHGILKQSITGNKLESNQQRMIEVSGNYTCITQNGCKDPYTLSLSEDGRCNLSVSYGDGAEILDEKGSWSIGEMGYITLSIEGNQSINYDVPKTILIKSVGTSTLARIFYTDKQYQNMTIPKFIKVIEE